MEWKPIATAPTDGRSILVYTVWRGGFGDTPARFHYQVGYWSVNRVAVPFGIPVLWTDIEPPEEGMWRDPTYHDDAGHFVERDAITIDPDNVVAPFDVQRVYVIVDTAPDVTRGGHAHRKLNQLAHCPKGSCVFDLEDASYRKWSVKLDHPTKGLLIGPGIWRTMRDFTPDCVLTVLADQHYDESDYIREYQKWRQEVGIPVPTA